MISEYELLQIEALQFIQDARTHRMKVAEKEEELEENRQALEIIKHDVFLLEEATIAVQELMDHLSKDHIEKLANMVTIALNTVFINKQYRFEIEVSEHGNNKQAELWLHERKDGQDVVCSVYDIGGGVQALIGFVFQVFYIQYLDVHHILLLDESFSQLSQHYIDGLFNFLRVLTDNYGFKVLFISHDERFMPYADFTVEMVDGYVKERSR